MLEPYFENEHGKLYHGDCLEIMPKLNVKVDMVLTDQPYGTTACKWDCLIPFEPMWRQICNLITSNGAIVMTASQPFTSTLIISNLKMFKYCWVWEKSKGSNFVHANFQPLKVHEDICVFSFGGSAQGSKNPMIYNPQCKEGKPYNKGVGHKKNENLSGGLTKVETVILENKTGKRKPRSVIYNKTSESEGKFHSTQKPVTLMEYLIKTYTNEDETVLDFCIGSGTTAIACQNTNRKWIGIEKEQKYCDITVNRLKEYENNINPFNKLVN